MKLRFDFPNVSLTEFGVGRDDGTGPSFFAVAVDEKVQAALREMVQTTWSSLHNNQDGRAKYEPSEKYASTECLYIPLAHKSASSIRQIHEAENINVNGAALSNPGEVFCYFARLKDTQGQRLSAVRRATQFKGVVKSRNRLVRMLDDTLKIIEDTVFKLDNEFDLLVDGSNVHILHPSGFEFVGKLQDAILEAVPDNVDALRGDLTFVNFDGIENYSRKHPRAARYLASIRGQEEIKNIDKVLLKKLCKQTGVEVRESNGELRVTQGHEMGFLEVLDRRRYEVSLIAQRPERYRASSRRKIDG